jgi:uncharacterized protein
VLNREVTVIVKVTNACDLQCRYCFIEPHVFHKRMSDETARRVVRALLDSDFFERVNFVWHGGEPLLRGREFYEKIINEQHAQPTTVRYTNSLQTNATRLDKTMASFLVGNGFHIGLSLDGPRELTDDVRRRRGGNAFSAHATTTAAARLLRDFGRVPGAIVVVNRANVNEPEAVYRELAGQRINIQLNPLARSGLAATDLGADLGINAEEYGDFLVRIFDVWFDDPNPPIAIEPLRHHVARALGLPGVVEACHFTSHCQRSFLGIAPDGDLFPCGLFQGERDFRYGNIHELAPEAVAATALFGRIEERERRVVAGCMDCAFIDLCYSGCMFHSLKNGGRFDEKDYYCAGYRMYFEHLLRRIHASAVPATA